MAKKFLVLCQALAKSKNIAPGRPLCKFGVASGSVLSILVALLESREHISDLSQPQSTAIIGAVDLTNCDREPIHVLGHVQGHGVFLVCSSATWLISQVSGNAAEFFGQSCETLIGSDVSTLLGASAVRAISNALENAKVPMTARVFHCALANSKTCHVAINQSSGRLLIELELSQAEQAERSPLEFVGALLARMPQMGSVQRLCDQVAVQIKTLTGFDRVMVYKFLADGSGKVVAEAKSTELEPFLDLHYPASDIPQQARALYLRNWTRLIADVASTPVPIFPERDASGEPVDLSLVGIRSVSPIHIEYLANMGVAASMSISLIVGGKLWGLIACHHGSANIVPMNLRAAAELLGQIISLQIESFEPNDRSDVLRASRQRVDKLLTDFPHTGALSDNLTERLPELRMLLPCDGVGFWIDGIWRGQGSVPPVREIAGIARFLIEAAARNVFATSELPHRYYPAEQFRADVSGVLAVPLSRVPRDYLMFFRREVVHTVKWAGDPSKPVTVGPRGDCLTPRKSFAVWESLVRGHSLPWSGTDRMVAEAVRIALLEVVLRLNEFASEERNKAAERQRLLISELNHRVKNVLTLISALVTRGHDNSENLASFVNGLSGRIKSLAFAHDQAIEHGIGHIGQVFEAETAPYKQKDPASITLSGPDIVLDAHAFSVLALVVHEMVTNAAKYGALSVASGRLDVAWSFDQSGNCIIDWDESGGPAVSPSHRNGFGTTLIDRQIAYELKGRSTVKFELTGVKAKFLIPAANVTEQMPQLIFSGGQKSAPPQAGGSLQGKRILLVEDSLLIALDAETMLRDAGAKGVEVVASAEAGLSAIVAQEFQAAVLDINLGRGTSLPVADELAKRNIPFIFASGYSDRSTIPQRFRHIRMVVKPYASATLVEAVLAAGDARQS